MAFPPCKLCEEKEAQYSLVRFTDGESVVACEDCWPEFVVGLAMQFIPQGDEAANDPQEPGASSEPAADDPDDETASSDNNAQGDDDPNVDGPSSPEPLDPPTETAPGEDDTPKVNEPAVTTS